MTSKQIHVAEYFAGIGLARVGLEAAGFTVSWSNDLSEKKRRLFQARFEVGGPHHIYHLGDLRDVTAADIPPDVKVAWASFPCTDLSVAGSGGGIHVGGSAAFWAFARNLAHLGRRRPDVVAIENVSGLVTNRQGKDLRTVIRVLNGLGYSVDLLSIDARHFVPQSRPRVFIIGEAGVEQPDEIDEQLWERSSLRMPAFAPFFADPSLKMHHRNLPALPPALDDGLSSAVDDIPSSSDKWWRADRVANFIQSLSPLQASRLHSLQQSGRVHFRAAYRRMRAGVARWEVRADGLAGCLRTARGGSSRQALVRIEGTEVRVRWMTGREYGRLMGAPEVDLVDFSESELMWGFGDAVCVPAVEWLGRNYLLPAAEDAAQRRLALTA
ncbi:DNA (cytosine-5-)-methyltransferase [Curtobacterium albidum]|uniref:DNA cytosine methyltransferase n=1 Tax=Curtobacterium citreum TaxID=2036 RepID=UPI002027334B|nr:DNA (cytosine-5-)-methyltransferase [Curtobacterium albidum]MCL9666296.1 DNA (cytosine-5-)-methyltransferase [Curtobacterium albidum]